MDHGSSAKSFSYLFIQANFSDEGHSIPSLSAFFEGLLSITEVPENTLYVLCDARAWEPEAEFFSAYDEMAEALLGRFDSYSTDWEELDDGELESWVDMVEDFRGVQMYEYGEEEDL